MERRFYRAPSSRYFEEVMTRIDATPLVGVLLVLVTAFLVVAIEPLRGTEIEIPRELGGCIDITLPVPPCVSNGPTWLRDAYAPFEPCEPQPVYLTFKSETPWSDVVSEVDAWKASAPEAPIAFVEERRR